jgi:hypothetical protein
MSSWEMFAAPLGDGDWTGVGNRWYARAHAEDGMPTPVLVTEDPEGDYLGWLETPEDEPWDEEPSMITRREIFSIQFPYGPEPEEAAGRGHAIRLTITERTVG